MEFKAGTDARRKGCHMDSYLQIVKFMGFVLDAVGVAAICIGALIATVRFFLSLKLPGDSIRLYRQSLGRAILVGLEFLVAGDIIRTVAVDLTLMNVAILGAIILIRTFLSMSLEMELGNVPWKQSSRS